MYLNSYFMAHITNPNNRCSITVQSRRNTIWNNREIRHWYLPHCTNAHWYYLRVDTVERRIIQSDPLNTRAQHYGRHLVDMLTDIYPGVWLLEYQQIKRQHNGYDCRPYILNTIIHTVNGITSYTGTPSRTLISRYLVENIPLVSFCSTVESKHLHTKRITQRPTQTKQRTNRHQDTSGKDNSYRRRKTLNQTSKTTKSPQTNRRAQVKSKTNPEQMSHITQV